MSILAPYDESLRLGQGYNSFLQTPCINDAVKISEASWRSSSTVTQITQVAYNARFIEKTSDLARSVGVSAASFMKSGTINYFGGSFKDDGASFASNELNILTSGKVITQSTPDVEHARFVPLGNVEMDFAKVFEVYGDCFISGSMEGGELFGLLSVRTLDKEDCSLRTTINNHLDQVNKAQTSDCFINAVSGLSATLDQMNTSLTVNWSGDGQIKPINEEWTLDSFIQAASSFPTRAAACPARTHAILTRYDDNPSFVAWASSHHVRVPRFDGTEALVGDLLDSFVACKRGLARLQRIMAEPERYRLAVHDNPIALDMRSFVSARRLMREETSKIGDAIDRLNADPSETPALSWKSPTDWMTRLPVLT